MKDKKAGPNRGWSRCLNKGAFAAVLALVLLSGANAGPAEPPLSHGDPGDHPAGDPGQLHRILYNGEPLRYTVLRNGKEVGFHTVTFREAADRLEVDTVFQIRISFLFFTYDYRYTSTGFWREGDLIAIEAEVDDDGDKSLVRALRRERRWVIDGPRGRQMVETAPALFATTHWNPGVIGSTRILNTLTGEVKDVVMENRGRTMVTVGSAQVAATEWAYTGGLETRVWYDDLGRWVRMVFEGKDGSALEVVAQSIGRPGRI